MHCGGCGSAADAETGFEPSRNVIGGQVAEAEIGVQLI
jgi:hypothetical protein